jgi:hypothetical protein
MRSRFVFILVTSFILLALMALQIINKRFWMHDFEVYYRAAHAFASGKQVYGIAFGLDSGFYKYSPVALFLFIPLSLLPFGTAKIIFFHLITGTTIITVLLTAKLLIRIRMGFSEFPNGILFLLLAIISSQVFRELHLGNINMILLLLMLTILKLILSEKQIAAGLIFAVVLFVKPHFLILAPLLLLRQYYKCLWVTFAGIVGGIITTIIISGTEGAINLYKQWFLIMQTHNQSLLQAPDTLYSWIYRLGFSSIYTETSVVAKVFPLLVLAVVAASFGWFVLANMHSERKSIQTDKKNHSFVIEFILLIALVPNLVLTDSEHFLLSTPIILFLIGVLYLKKQSHWFTVMTLLAIILYGMNIHDLVGSEISGWLTRNGILGLGNLLLIGLAIYAFLRNESSNNPEIEITQKEVI